MAAAYPPPPRGRGAAGCSRPAPARSSGRPARDAADVGGPTPGSAWRTGRWALVEPADVRPPGKVQVQWTGPGPPQPQHLGRTRLGGDAFDLDPDDGAAHDRPGPAGAVAGMALLFGMQPTPGGHGHGAGLVVLADQGGGRGGAGGGG